MSAGPRVVSLLPSATEMAVALGVGENLLGRSHACDFPPWVERLPALTSTKIEKGLSAGAIEARVREIIRKGLSVYDVDAEALRRMRPDIILTQSQCAICAVTPADLEEALACWVGAAPALLSLAPDTLEDVRGDVRRVAEALSAQQAGARVLEAMDRRFMALRNQTRGRTRPRVAAIEWADPLMIAGNWIPELIEIAGGVSILAAPGQHSPVVEWAQLIDADPDVIVLMPCGYVIEETLAERALLERTAGWLSLRAVREDRVFAVDGRHLFNRPGPRLVESAECLFEVLHANGSQRRGPYWQRF